MFDDLVKVHPTDFDFLSKDDALRMATIVAVSEDPIEDLYKLVDKDHVKAACCIRHRNKVRSS